MKTTLKSLSFALLLTGTSAHAAPLSAAAFAAIDWSTLEIDIVGDGNLVFDDDVFFENTALATDEHFNPVSVDYQVFAPAIAAHPFIEDTASVAGFDDETTSAASSAFIGSSSAESNTSFGFQSFGSGIAHISVDYALTVESSGGLVGHAGVALAVSKDGTDGFLGDGLLFDGAEIGRLLDPGVSADVGTLSLLFGFSETDLPFLRLNGSASVFSAGVVAAPVPAALPLMLSALGFVGFRARRHSATV